MRIFNADGSEVDACGNATRCIPLFLGRDCRIETNAGLLNAELHGEGASVDMGQPRFGWDEIPLAYAMDKLRSEEHTSELQSLMRISYAVFFLNKNNKTQPQTAMPRTKVHTRE